MSVKRKNIHVLPTDKPSRLYYNNNKKCLQLCEIEKQSTQLKENKNIYITSDEEIKEGEYQLYNPLGNFDNAKVSKAERLLQNDGRRKKIILTTDVDLIKDGVQAFVDEFLEWFFKNPSCEFVEVGFSCRGFNGAIPNLKPIGEYKIFIPKEEPKQETLEEAAEEFSNNSAVNNYEHGINVGKHQGFIAGTKWQQERMYSYEEVLEQLNLLYGMKNSLVDTFTDENDYITMKWFEQFKKK